MKVTTRVITIKYKQSTKPTLFFFDAKKEPKKHLGGCESHRTLYGCFYFSCFFFPS